MTYEHIPPETAFNNNKATIYTGNEVLKRYKGEKSRYISRQRGMGKFTLCRECNNKTGSWYVPQYSNVVKNVVHGLSQIPQLKHGNMVEQRFMNFPALPFAKQVITMFCSLLPIEEVIKLGFDQLLLDKESNKIDSELFDLRIYLTPINVGQLMVGPTVVMFKTDDGFETATVCDLGVYPFGFILNLTPEYPVEYGVSMMKMLHMEYNKEYNLNWELMYLERTSDILPMPLVFKSLDKGNNGFVDIVDF